MCNESLYASTFNCISRSKVLCDLTKLIVIMLQIQTYHSSSLVRGPSSAGLLLLLGPASVSGYCCYVCSPGRASSSSSLSLLLPSPLPLRNGNAATDWKGKRYTQPIFDALAMIDSNAFSCCCARAIVILMTLPPKKLMFEELCSISLKEYSRHSVISVQDFHTWLGG